MTYQPAFVLLSHFDAIHDFIGFCHSYLSVVLVFRLRGLNCVPSSRSSSGQQLSEWMSGQLPWLAQPLTGQQLLRLFKLICLPVSLTHVLQQAMVSTELPSHFRPKVSCCTSKRNPECCCLSVMRPPSQLELGSGYLQVFSLK